MPRPRPAGGTGFVRLGGDVKNHRAPVRVEREVFQVDEHPVAGEVVHEGGVGGVREWQLHFAAVDRLPRATEVAGLEVVDVGARVQPALLRVEVHRGGHARAVRPADAVAAAARRPSTAPAPTTPARPRCPS